MTNHKKTNPEDQGRAERRVSTRASTSHRRNQMFPLTGDYSGSHSFPDYEVTVTQNVVVRRSVPQPQLPNHQNCWKARLWCLRATDSIIFCHRCLNGPLHPSLISVLYAAVRGSQFAHAGQGVMGESFSEKREKPVLAFPWQGRGKNKNDLMTQRFESFCK